MRIKVLSGKNGHLFLNNDSNGVIAQIEGRKLLTKPELDRWYKILSHRISCFREMGIGYYNILAPDKHTVYREFLPDHLIEGREKVADQFVNLADRIKGMNIVYPRDELIIGRKKRRLIQRSTRIGIILVLS